MLSSPGHTMTSFLRRNRPTASCPRTAFVCAGHVLPCRSRRPRHVRRITSAPIKPCPRPNRRDHTRPHCCMETGRPRHALRNGNQKTHRPTVSVDKNHFGQPPHHRNVVWSMKPVVTHGALARRIRCLSFAHQGKTQQITPIVYSSGQRSHQHHQCSTRLSP